MTQPTGPAKHIIEPVCPIPIKKHKVKTIYSNEHLKWSFGLVLIHCVLRNTSKMNSSFYWVSL